MDGWMHGPCLSLFLSFSLSFLLSSVRSFVHSVVRLFMLSFLQRNWGVIAVVGCRVEHPNMGWIGWGQLARLSQCPSRPRHLTRRSQLVGA